MASGQPTGPQPQGQYPGYAPVYQPRRPLAETARSMVSDLVLALAAIVGLLLLMISWVVFGLAEDSGGFDAAEVLRALGLFILVSAMLAGAMLRMDLDKWVRVSMIAGSVLLIVMEGFWVLVPF